MVDEYRVLRLLRSIADDTAVLRQEAGASEERRQDPIWLRGVKYTFVTAIEACVDVVDRLKSLGDLEEFVRQVAAYVTSAQPEPESSRQPRG